MKQSPASVVGGASFATTHWSAVWNAKQADPEQAAQAMERLCRDYWPPLFAYIRRSGHSEADAKDLTQGFFARLIERTYLDQLHHQEGKFRSFLLSCLKFYLLEEHGRSKAQKRGGGAVLISLDAWEEEERRPFAPVDSLTPEQAFERRWAQQILELAARQLEEEYEAAGKGRLFAAIKDVHAGERSDAGYKTIGAELGLSETAIKSAVQRMRTRHRDILRNCIAETITSKDELGDEIRHFVEILR